MFFLVKILYTRNAGKPNVLFAHTEDFRDGIKEHIARLANNPKLFIKD